MYRLKVLLSVNLSLGFKVELKSLKRNSLIIYYIVYSRIERLEFLVKCSILSNMHRIRRFGFFGERRKSEKKNADAFTSSMTNQILDYG